MKWYDQPEIVSYLIDCYAGVENINGREKRQFIWEDEHGDIVIGNSRAFSDHVRAKFGLEKSDTAWMSVHEALRALGEVVQVHQPRRHIRGGKFTNQEPETRVIKKKS